MRVLIMTDMEGISGVMVWDQVGVGEVRYEEGRRLYTEDVNAAVRGAAAAGATQIVVREFHGGLEPYHLNHLIPELLDENCEWIAHHYASPREMMQENRFDACVIVGAHAMAGTPDGVLAHTITGGWNYVKINGEPVGEVAVFGYMLGYYGIPVVAVTGDTAVCEETTRMFGDSIKTIAVKKGLSQNSAQIIAPLRARKLIEQGVQAALEDYAMVSPLKPPSPVRIEIEVKQDGGENAMARQMAQLPNVTAPDANHVVIEAEDYMDAFSRIFGWVP